MKTLIKDLPDIERPRERFMEVGPSNLSNLELISIILKKKWKNRKLISKMYILSMDMACGESLVRQARSWSVNVALKIWK